VTNLSRPKLHPEITPRRPFKTWRWCTLTEQLINRHLRLVGSKVKASAFLVRLHEFEQKHGSMPGCSGSVGASPGPATDEAEEVEG
jgi:hypothetical protein